MSLAESCVTAAIISTVMAIATPSLFRVRETYVLNSAAREVAAKLQGARIAAITRNRDCRIKVTSSVSYMMECQGNVWEPIETVVLPRGIAISANARPEFHRRGNVSPAATISVSNTSGRRVRIVVNINGRVRLQ